MISTNIASIDLETARGVAPLFNIRHIKRISTSFGILQHAKFNIPNYHHGYCLDDNSRALLLMAKALSNNPEDTYDELFQNYLTFIYYAQREDGRFRNFVGMDCHFLDEQGTEDSFGRTIWAIGYVLATPALAEYHAISREILDRALDACWSIRSLRAAGYTLLGLLHFLESSHQNEATKIVKHLAGFLQNEFQLASSKEWPWFESVVSYDNAILPLALLRAGIKLDQIQWRKSAENAFSFLHELLFQNDHISLIGNQSWYTKGQKRSRFGQQPIEIYSAILLYDEFARYQNNPSLMEWKKQAFLWFFGFNDQGALLYDQRTKGCCDGLEAYGVNRNQGAESTLSFWLSHWEIFHPSTISVQEPTF
ncbi:MAG: hypothetical protein ACTHZ1_03300 [Sphingobacterium sp.]